MVYFEKAGQENTQMTLEYSVDRAKELGIKHIVVASHTGKTINELLDLLEEKDLKDELKVSCVTHHVGYREPGKFEMDDEIVKRLEKENIKMLTTTHLFANIERDITNKIGGLYPGGIISATLRCFGQGVKVCFEISVMALDAGLVPYGEDVITIGGKGRGADTSVIIAPAHAKNFFDTKLKEVICMPRD